MGTRELTAAQIEGYEKSFYADRANVIAANAATKSGVLAAASDYKGIRANAYSFSVDLKQGSITAQKSSGRCWLFAALNTLRFEMMKKWNLEDFELSQNYPFFYDKLEKANYYLENILRTLDEPVSGRLYNYLGFMPVNDGGQWDMFVNIVRKYGLVPKAAYPESANSSNTTPLNSYLSSKLREYAAELRKAAKAGASMEELRGKKAEQLEAVYRMLVISLGEPPKTFDFTCKAADGTVLQDFGISPKEFYDKYIGIDLGESVSLINAPTQDKPFYKTYTVKYLGNVEEGNPVKYLNLPIEVIKAAVVEQLKDGHPVWFGSDCSRYAAREEGIFDRGSVAVEQLFQIHYEFDKAQRLEYFDSYMNHAMVFLGVNLDQNGRPDRWRIENSWGGDAGIKGYFVASDEWFEEFVYQVVVNKKYLDEELVKLTEQEPVQLEPWDPMGSLAD